MTSPSSPQRKKPSRCLQDPAQVTKYLRWVAVFACAVLIAMLNYGSRQSSETPSPDTRVKQSNQAPSKGNSTSFAEKWCDYQGVDLYPSGELAWQQRTPAFMLIGAKKAGTTSLSMYLDQHPQIIGSRTKELRYFLPHLFVNWRQTRTGPKVLVERTRNEMYQGGLHGDYKVERIKADESLLTFEATPGYLFQPESIPPILCAAPWVKVLVILRNPIDRVFSHYNFLKDPSRVNALLPPIEQWIERDMTRLRNAGVIQDRIPNDEFFGSAAEDEAWGRYHNELGTREGPIGRSLYAIQLGHWYKALQELGRDPDTDIMVVKTEDLKDDTDGLLDRIVSWLGLPSFELQKHKEVMITHYTSTELSNETRTMLHDLFKPYNERLDNLLGESAGWADMWEHEAPQQVPKDRLYHGNPISAKQEKMLQQRIANYSQLTNYDKSEYNEKKAAEFANKWCDLEGTEFYPSGEDQQWQLRTPYFMLPGAKKSGTTSLSNYIMQHPLVAKARTKELQFFMNKNFREKYVTDNQKTLVAKAREMMYTTEYNSEILQKHVSMISFDATPGYLFFSSMLPQRILCVTPWIKLVVILRNPVDRAFSNHAYVERMSGRKFKFEKWIKQDLKFLNESGYLDATSADEGAEAWRSYLTLCREGQIGRGIYVQQLRQWFQAIRDSGRDPTTQVHIVRSEDIKADLDGEYRKVLEFLGLPYVPLQSTEEKVVSTYESPMKAKTRKKLEAFYEPYNHELYDLLGNDWEGFWDPAPDGDG